MYAGCATSRAEQGITVIVDQGHGRFQIETEVREGFTTKTAKVDYTFTDQKSLISNLKSKSPLVHGAFHGLFVGISDFPADSKLHQNVAHTVSALFLREVFMGMNGNHGGSSINADIVRLHPIISVARPANDPALPNLDYILKEVRFDNIKYHDRQARKHFGPRPDGLFEVFNNQEPITRARLRHELKKSLQLYGEAVRATRRGLFVFYINTHGGFTDTGKTLLYCSDSKLADPNTAVDAEGLLDRIYALQNKLIDEEIESRMLLIVDCCRNSKAAIGESYDAAISAPPRGTAVVYSASPGQFAWHWPGMVHSNIVIHSVSSSADFVQIPLVDGHKVKQVTVPARNGKVDLSYETRMSILPWAALAMRENTKAAAKAGYIADRWDTSGVRTADMLVRANWCDELLGEDGNGTEPLQFSGDGWGDDPDDEADSIFSFLTFVSGITGYLDLFNSVVEKPDPSYLQNAEIRYNPFEGFDGIFAITHEDIKHFNEAN